MSRRVPSEPPPVRRSRVAYLAHTSALSGAELALLHVLPGVTRHVDVVVVLAEDGPLADRLAGVGVETLVLPLREDVRTVHRDAVTLRGTARQLVELGRHVLALRRLLRARRVDVVHCNSLKSSFYGGLAGRLAGVAVVWHLRDRIDTDSMPPRAVRLVRAAARVLPDVVVANSRATLTTVFPHDGGPRWLPRRTVVLDGVEGPGPRPVPVPVTPGPVVGMVGRLAPGKGQDLFLRAFAAAFAGTSARAVVVGSAMFGEDAYAATLSPLCERLGIAGQVEFRGFREDVWAELARMDVLVHCSTSPEPFGQVVVEGMAAGLCVLAADEGGPREIVRDGVDGLLVPPRDVDALAAAMASCVADPALRARLGRAARQRAQEFSVGASAGGLVDVYERLAPAHRRVLAGASR